jgi:hypothetical protein
MTEKDLYTNTPGLYFLHHTSMLSSKTSIFVVGGY